MTYVYSSTGHKKCQDVQTVSFVKVLVLLACPARALGHLFKLPPERVGACDCLGIQTEAGFLGEG